MWRSPWLLSAVTLADRTAAGSQIPESHGGGGAEAQECWRVAVGCGAEFPSTSPALQPVSLLRKTVDHFSHGGAGWQGLVTENVHQPTFNLAFKEPASAGLRPLSACAPRAGCEGSGHTAGRKGTLVLFSLPTPCPC